MRIVTTARRLLSRQTAGARPLPTADFYFRGPLRDLIAEADTSADAIRQIGPHCYACGANLVIIRYAAPDELASIAARRWESVRYIIDDLIPAAASSPELPADYRNRLADFAANRLPRILALHPTIVAPSKAILDTFPDHEGELLDPCCLALADNRHMQPTAWTHPLRFAFLGTRSHEGSLDLVTAIADRLASRLPGSTVHLFFGKHLPKHLRGHPSIRNSPPLAWPQFRRWMADAQFHAALAPVQPTPFARARSITKVMDHAEVGAVGLYGREPPFSQAVTDGVNGRLISFDPDAWAECLIELAHHPDKAQAMAAAGIELARTRGNPARIRQFWMERLRLPDPAAPAAAPSPRPRPTPAD